MTPLWAGKGAPSPLTPHLSSSFSLPISQLRSPLLKGVMPVGKSGILGLGKGKGEGAFTLQRPGGPGGRGWMGI